MSASVYGRDLPTEATVFADPESGARAAARMAKGVKRQFRTEPAPKGDGFVVRFWPVGASPICAERKFLRVAVARKPTHKKRESWT